MVWEEYRYDPLGRRVLVNTRRESPYCNVSGPTCLNGVTRFVWSGDQILWELKDVEGSYGAEAGGRVSYLHAGGIDRPLAIWKQGVGTLVTHQSWRGQFALGTYTSGASSDCAEYPPQGCVPVRWPGWATTAWHQEVENAPETGSEHYWFGSLADGMRDQSGQMYMRNRYYDPATGQFTQPDPIGLAGGLNAYGFAAGDPVTYSDPYGLCPGEGKDGEICIDFFISAKWAWGFRGDDRGHDPNAPADRSRAQIIVDPESGTFRGTVDASCSFVGCSPARRDNEVSGFVDGAGVIYINFRLKDSAAPFGLAPDLDGTIMLQPDGKGGYVTHGDVSAYPSSDIYQRKGGQWVPIRAPHDETSPVDLFDAAGRHRW